ncbi:STAS domain-containing protein [Sinisalibacter aestuarii]|uniref:STAS domain-containing protein n=1 Tax=Sinisalibacter aestuarii TaxID=2949426 RepID=A0ABQ5LRR7_9RHOB|nr:STAS domain-containing protein [Sinisalibacter aestuarii]GKY87694.1 hypothetical protein STA1M1_15630 [Sinisalibacter aestuarii]
MTAQVLRLDPRLDLRSAAPLAQALLAARGADLDLDAAGVTLLGALPLQAIRAAARSWAADGHRLTLVNASDDLADQLALLGFTAATVTQWEVLP